MYFDVLYIVIIVVLFKVLKLTNISCDKYRSSAAIFVQSSPNIPD